MQEIDQEVQVNLREAARSDYDAVKSYLGRIGAAFYDKETNTPVNPTPVLEITDQMRSYVSREGRWSKNLSKRLFLKEDYRNPLTESVKGRAVAAMVLSAIGSGLIYTQSGKKKKWVEPTSGNTGKGLAEIAKLLGIEFTAVFSRLDVSEDIKSELDRWGAKSITIGSEYSLFDLESLAKRHHKSVQYYWTSPGRISEQSLKLIQKNVAEIRGKESVTDNNGSSARVKEIDEVFFIDRILPPAADALRSPLTARIERGEFSQFKKEAPSQIPELNDRNTIVGFICPMGNTSMALNTLFSQLGFGNVCSIKGGVQVLRDENGQNSSSTEYCPLPGSSISSSSIDFVKKLVEEHADEYFTFMQYENIENVNAHVWTTGPELKNQIPNLRSVFCTFGTGGTATGLAQYFKAKGVRVYAAFPEKPVEGIRTIRGAEGLAFYRPEAYEGVLEVDNSKANDLLKYFVESDIKIGPSSAIALQAAIESIYTDEVQNDYDSVAIIAADSIKNYSTEYADNLKISPD